MFKKVWIKNLPVGQAVHVILFAVAYCPAAQGFGATVLSEHSWPAVHDWQLVWPVFCWYSPSGHSVAAVIPLLGHLCPTKIKQCLLKWHSFLWFTKISSHVVHLALLSCELLSTLFYYKSSKAISLYIWIHYVDEKQCGSWSAGFIRSQLIWIYIVLLM